MTQPDTGTDGQRLRDTLTFRGTGERPIWALENIDALLAACEEFKDYWVGG